MKHVVVVKVLADGSVYRLSTNPLILGSSAAVSDLVLDNPTVSRRHTQVSLGEDGLEVRDMGSDNGTWVERGHGEPHKIMEAWRCRRCKLWLGSARVEFIWEKEA